jgi:mono/diheme cytochrome c family protein
MRFTISHKACVVIMLMTSGCSQKMADQPRYDALQESAFFADGLSARPVPDGTIARDFATKDQLLDLGLVAGEPVTNFPYPITMDLLSRGQERYNIYCTPCHDYLGTGSGMAVQRGFRTKPPSFHSAELLSAPPGRYFDVITNGFGAMPSYANQVQAPDRWAIIAYIRALQLSQSASPQDVPADELRRLQ